MEQLLSAGDVGVYQLHLCAADDELIVYLVDVDLDRFLGDVGVAAGVVEGSFSRLQADEHLAVEEYLGEVDRSGGVPFRSESRGDEAKVGGGFDGHSTTVLDAFLG